MRQFIILVLLITSFKVYSQAVKYSNEFLSIGVGARAYGMGSSVASTVNDATAGYWNPAALVDIPEKVDATLMHSEQISQIVKFDYAGFAYRLDTATVVGISAHRMGVDNIQNTLNLYDAQGNIDFNRVTMFSVADYAFFASLARKSSIKNLSYGANLKVIRRTVGDFASAWGFGVDLAAKYTLNKWQFSAVGKDITSTFNAWSFNEEEFEDIFLQTGNVMPDGSLELTLPKIVIGAAYSFKINERFSSVAEVNFDNYFDGKRNAVISSDFITLAPHVGIELEYKEMIFLRGGIRSIQYIETLDKAEKLSVEPAFGLGLSLWNFYLDYAITGLGEVSLTPYSHVLSLRYAFSPKE